MEIDLWLKRKKKKEKKETGLARLFSAWFHPRCLQ
jgi:hypothetical protein